MNCPNCNSVIASENINIQTDIARCQNCNHIFKISDHVLGEEESDDLPVEDFDINDPPNGAWMRHEMNQLVLGASTRSPAAFFLVPFMLIWSGGSLGGIYGSQFISGEFDLFMSLFGIPFLLGSILFWGITALTIWGKIELTFNRYGGEIFTGVGKIGRRQKFDWDDVSKVREVWQHRNRSSRRGARGGMQKSIVLEGQKRLTFGMWLKDSRQYYLYQATKFIIQKVKSNQNFI